MAKKPTVTTLNASTIDILNVIRKNASATYRDKIPTIENPKDIPAVGDVLFGYPALANEFIEALVGRIAYVAIKSATFYNPYADLKKGYLMTGEMVEDIFVNIAKVYSFHNDTPVEKQELGKEEPDVKTAFYPQNWQVQYKTSVSDEQLRTAFTSMDGVQDLINRIIETVYTAEKYDEFLLFKYLMIKSVNQGLMTPVNAGADTKSAAKAFRGYSNLATFPSTNYNEAGVLNGAPRDRQVIFMDAVYNAEFDVEQLASAFNMDKTDFFGRLYLMDSWTTFDNERWAEIRAQGTQVEEVTAEELEIMGHVKAILVDEDWFQIYDKLLQLSNTYVASKLTWNYFLTSFKIVAHSPFANAVVFVDNEQAITLPAEITANVTDVSLTNGGGISIITLQLDAPDGTINGGNPQFVQTEELTTNGVAVHEYGTYLIPKAKTAVVTVSLKGKKYTSGSVTISASTTPGTKLTLSPQSAMARTRAKK